MARRPAGPARDGGRRARSGAIAPDAATSARAPASASAEAASPENPSDPNLVLLGEFGRAQGLAGEVRLKSYTGDPMAIAGYGPLVTADGRTVRLSDVRPVPGTSSDMLIARVQGVAGRTAAETLNRIAVYVPRDRLGEPDADEVFSTDLIGASAVDRHGTPVGTVVAVPNYGGGDLLEVRPVGGGPTALLPFTRAFVPELDLAAGRIVVAPPDDFFVTSGEKPADDPG